MKKIVLQFLFAFIITNALFANPGDTTWVYANNVQLNYYNNFDTVVTFPNGSKTYRNILMYFTLGEYNCPPASTYCHQWDYTVINYVLTSTDTTELSRLITPYANTGVPRFPSTWTQRYVYDVTDYSSKLQNSAKIRILYSGYSGGFTANIKFAFIEGVPERNVKAIQNLYRGSYTFGNPSNPISSNVTVKNFTAPAVFQSAELKYCITGHGSDNTTQCCEFASHTYSVMLNGSQVAQQAVWRNDCGFNQLYPQGGTWLYDRANWCPGDAVSKYSHLLPGLTASSNYSLGVSFDTYTTTGNYGSYTMDGHVVYYGPYNHTTDAYLKDVIAPNNFEWHFRENPSGSIPRVKVHNNGTANINSLTFNYGVKDSVFQNYTWTGTLSPQADSTIALPALNTLLNISMTASSSVNTFIARITNVNGAADEDTTNNIQRTNFNNAPNYPSKFVIQFKTNSEGVSGINMNPSETSWIITDMNNNTLYSRTNANVNTTYNDTVNLPPNAFYKLAITDLGCDGLHWWVWDQNPSYGVTAGYLVLKKIGSNVLYPMNGYSYSGTYNNDFGCGYSQYFTTNTVSSVGLTNNTLSQLLVEVFPNPANSSFSILVNKLDAGDKVEIYDVQGRKILDKKLTENVSEIGTENFSAGLYSVKFISSTGAITTKKIVITK
ncbi:MAG: T9SS type A sorting domain-containing protein [Bacteroidetes bacterium]|nr:T9SS type A sorting domain-containing protein [Bacteroidota bacterium]